MEFIGELGKINLNRIPVAFFNTYIGDDLKKTVKKIGEQIAEKVPALKEITLGLSIMVKSASGLIPQEKLPKCRQFSLKFGEVLKG